MNLLTFFEDDTIMAAMTLRDCTAPLCGSMALHTGEEAGAVMENRRRLSEETLPLSRWCCAMQTHSANAYAVTAEDAGRGALTIDDAIPACDALYTRERGVLIGVFTADCVPLLLHDPHSGIIAAIHAGWPGTVKQITHHTVSRLIEREGLDARTVQVWIGPCIHQPSFQIREDVIAQIRALPFDTSPYLQMQADAGRWQRAGGQRRPQRAHAARIGHTCGTHLHQRTGHLRRRRSILLLPPRPLQRASLLFPV